MARVYKHYWLYFGKGKGLCARHGEWSNSEECEKCNELGLPGSEFLGREPDEYLDPKENYIKIGEIE